MPAYRPLTTRPPVIQRYTPNSGDIKKTFWIKNKNGTWTKAVLMEIVKDKGCYFRTDYQEDFVFIGNDRNISEKKPSGNSKNQSMFLEHRSYTECMAADCDAKFDTPEALHKHMRRHHKFPRQDKYPYALFGGQAAKSYVFEAEVRNDNIETKKRKWSGLESTETDDWQSRKYFTLHSERTGNDLHSEFNSARWLPRKKLKRSKDSEDEARDISEDTLDLGDEQIDVDAIKTDFEEFMSTKGPGCFYFTGEPHCGLCSASMEISKMPTIYPTDAKPSQSPFFKVPSNVPKFESVISHLGGDIKGKGSAKYGVLSKEGINNFLPKSRQSYNADLRLKKPKLKSQKNELREKQHITQAMALSKMMYDKFFDSVQGEEPKSREEIKKLLARNPVPKNPWTYDLYIPSPSRESDEEYDKRIKIMKQEQSINEIWHTYNGIKEKKQKVTVEDDTADYLDPIANNNCLITAMNGGAEASQEEVTMIRYLLFEHLNIPYGRMLQASPEVIFTIANVLSIRGVTLVIEQDKDLVQQFAILGDGNVIELEGDEAEELNLPAQRLSIRHTGGNHFSFAEPEEKH